jgi:hypothetical protein
MQVTAGTDIRDRWRGVAYVGPAPRLAPDFSHKDIPMKTSQTPDRTTTLRADVSTMNDVFARAGLYPMPRPRIHPFGAGGHEQQELSMLRKIRLEDNKENWFKGDAEIFAITSGFTTEGKAFVKAEPMLWLAKEKVDYHPDMPLVNWAECGAPYVNLQMFDKDGDTDFQKLAVGLVEAVNLGLKLNPTTAPYAAVSEVGKAILAAMDPTWFKNNPDYVDSIYLIERGKTYTNKVGAANNATVTIEPYIVG